MRKIIPFIMVILTTTLFGLNLVATINPYYLLLKDLVASTNCGIHLLIKPTSNPHTFSPTISDVKKLSAADFVLANGLDLEPYLKGYKNVIYASDFIPKEFLIEADEHQEDHHDHGKFNPHIWLSPKLVKDFIIPKVVEVLSQKDPQNEEIYRKNAFNLIKRLEDIQVRLDQTLRNFENGVLVITHPSTVYLTSEYKIKTLALEEGHGKEPSAKKIKEIIEEAKQRKLLGIFAEKQFNPKLLEQIAKELKQKIIVIDHLGVEANNIVEYYENLLKAFQEAVQAR
ncbi:metal ABC transporter substrate-binding protein [Pseudothermotoga thermarum]|uniref:Periplasmic solute binding protein n=1 Tax=Pseudothermotoga thermarum DSM 5069 TaxID=688269 RepID=F7YU07_9THEM|nr:metal ABC transporter substrate-binding protein [Pseudothermotoga thermarum]AEH51589.1 periplasmic solute binding protein [Pseudothermotoga thermarum DSM 5069]